MALPPTSKVRQYFILRGEQEIGPLTMGELNRMHASGEITSADQCRASDGKEHHPLGKLFPHLGNFVRKPMEEHRREARNAESKWQSNVALACGVISLFGATLVLSTFAIVYGIKVLRDRQDPKAGIGMVLGIIAFGLMIYRIFFVPA
jgi:hypothetical protein